MIGDYLGGAIVTGLSGLLGTGISQQSAAESAREYNRGQMELAKYQNEWNLAQWERENAYNSPAQQMQRYREAGLNANLIYGQQNLAASSPTAATPNLKPVPKMSGALGKFLQSLDIRNIMMDIDMKEAQMDLVKSQAGYYQELQKNLGSRTEGQTLFNTYYGDPDNMFNMWKQNSYLTSLRGVQAREAQNQFDLDWKNSGWENYKDSRRYYENHIVHVQSDKYDFEYDLSQKYDAKMYQAQIYNLINGNKAQQTSAKGSLLSGKAAMMKAGLEGDKWNKLQDLIVKKYGQEVSNAFWNGVLLFERADTYYNDAFNRDLKTRLDYLKFGDQTDEEFYDNAFKLVDKFLKFFPKR